MVALDIIDLTGPSPSPSPPKANGRQVKNTQGTVPVIDLSNDDYDNFILHDEGAGPSKPAKRKKTKNQTLFADEPDEEIEEGEVVPNDKPKQRKRNRSDKSPLSANGKLSRNDSKSGPPTPKQQPNSRRNSPPPSLFFEDAEPGTVDAALRFPVPIPSTSAEIDYTSEPKETLLLPDHVRLVQEGDVSSQPPVNGSTLAEGLHDGVSGSPPSDTSAIEYLDEHPKPFGTGRYFEDAVRDDSGRVCTNCKQEGHISKNCPVQVCWTCGAVNEHNSFSCPVSIVCFNCRERGHMSRQCPKPRAYGACTRCGSRNHVDSNCPTLWRQYVYNNEETREEELRFRNKKKGLPLGDGGEAYVSWEACCYNCGSFDHWGDECEEPFVTDRPPDNSAFSILNVLSGPFAQSSMNRGASYDAYPGERSGQSRSRHQASSTFDDGYGFTGEAHVGKKSKEAARKRQREAAREQDEDDEENWFSRRDGRKDDRSRTNGTSAPTEPGNRAEKRKLKLSLADRPDGGQYGSNSKGKEKEGIVIYEREAHFSGRPNDHGSSSRGKSYSNDRYYQPDGSQHSKQSSHHHKHSAPSGSRRADEKKYPLVFAPPGTYDAPKRYSSRDNGSSASGSRRDRDHDYDRDRDRDQKRDRDSRDRKEDRRENDDRFGPRYRGGYN